MKSEHARFSTNQKWTMASTSSGFALEHMDDMFLSFALAPIIMQLHISGAAGGMMSSITNLSKLVGAVIFGILADTFGRVKVFTYTIFLVAIGTAAMYFVNDLGWIYFVRFLIGLGAGGEYGAGVTLISENFRHHHVSSLISYAASIGQCGAILAAVISALVLPAFGWHTLFLFGLIPVALVYLIRRNLKENPDFVRNVKLRRRKHARRVPISRLFSTPQVAWQTLAIIVMVMVEAAGYYGLMNWLPSIMQRQLHIDISKSSIWMIMTIIGTTFGMIAFGKIMDRWGPRWAFSVFLIGAAIVVYTIVMSDSSLTLLLAATLVGFFAGATYSGYGTIVSRLYPMEIRVTANNLIMSAGKAIGGFSPVLIGFLMDYYSLFSVMACLSGLYILSLVMMFTIPNLRNFNEKSSQSV